LADGAVAGWSQGSFLLPNRAKITTPRLLPRYHGKERRRASTKAVGGGLNGGGAPACGMEIATKREGPDAPGRLTSSRYLGPRSPLPRLSYCMLPTAAGRGGRPCLGASLACKIAWSREIRDNLVGDTRPCFGRRRGRLRRSTAHGAFAHRRFENS
jgi:hypothetical protein